MKGLLFVLNNFIAVPFFFYLSDSIQLYAVVATSTHTQSHLPNVVHVWCCKQVSHSLEKHKLLGMEIKEWSMDSSHVLYTLHDVNRPVEY